jgi:hypothetical protein
MSCALSEQWDYFCFSRAPYRFSEWHMSSATELIAPEKSKKERQFRAEFERWNRKLHFYSGLFLLFFMWLFALSGLLLNHPTWSFAESWNNRKERNFEKELTVPGPETKGDLAQAREILRQLNIEGEILWTATRTNPELFEFQVRRPGHFFFIKSDFARKRVNVRHSEVNLWGVAKVLHVFSGVQLDDPRNRRDWALTSLWAFSMDALAVGLIFMVLSSVYMWLKLPHKRLLGAVVLALGSLLCALFCIGLRWLF